MKNRGKLDSLAVERAYDHGKGAKAKIGVFPVKAPSSALYFS